MDRTGSRDRSTPPISRSRKRKNPAAFATGFFKLKYSGFNPEKDSAVCFVFIPGHHHETLGTVTKAFDSLFFGNISRTVGHNRDFLGSGLFALFDFDGLEAG